MGAKDIPIVCPECNMFHFFIFYELFSDNNNPVSLNSNGPVQSIGSLVHGSVLLFLRNFSDNNNPVAFNLNGPVQSVGSLEYVYELFSDDNVCDMVFRHN
jgi:hypothetical protein